MSGDIEYNSTGTFNLMYHSASFYHLSPIVVTVAAAGPYGFSLKIKKSQKGSRDTTGEHGVLAFAAHQTVTVR